MATHSEIWVRRFMIKGNQRKDGIVSHFKYRRNNGKGKKHYRDNKR